VTRPTRTPVDPGYLRDLFSRSARFYDPVNTVTSLGQVGRWRAETIALAALQPTDRLLDAFCGPGGLAERALAELGRENRLVLVDLSPVMIRAARGRLALRSDDARSLDPRIAYVTGDLLRDDLGLGTFDVVLLGWALRYVPDPTAAVARLTQFLRPRGRLVILEFTKPTTEGWALPAHFYFRRILPRLGSWLARDRELHDYLHASTETLLDMQALNDIVCAAGLASGESRTHLGGLVTVLAATRP